LLNLGYRARRRKFFAERSTYIAVIQEKERTDFSSKEYFKRYSICFFSFVFTRYIHHKFLKKYYLRLFLLSIYLTLTTDFLSLLIKKQNNTT